MSVSLEDIASDALQLPQDQRLTLAHRILASLEPGPDAGAEAAWDGEIRERIRKYDAGRTSAIPGSIVFEELGQETEEMNYEFLEEARDEFWEAGLYYESKEAGLGIRFRMEVMHVIEHVAADSYLWREQQGGYRRVNCPVFPYYVSYFMRADKIVIAAVAHGHRLPGYWKTRVKNS